MRKSLFSSQRGRLWPWLLLALAALSLLLWLALRGGPQVAAMQIQPRPLMQTVVATGRITTPARMALGSQVVAQVTAVRVEAGQRVAAGEVLVQLRSDEADAAVAQARIALEQAQWQQAELERVHAPVAAQAVRQAQADWTLAQVEHQRVRDLVARRFYAPASLDTAERSLQRAQAQLATARTQHQATLPGGASHSQALAQQQQARAALERAQAQRALLTLHAPADAVVLTREVEPGDVASAGSVLLTLAAVGETRIHATLDERNLPLLHEGMAAQAVADAYPHQPFAAQLYYVSPAVDAQRGTVELRLRVPEPPDFLRPDMTASVEIITGQKDDALTLPFDWLHDADGPAPWVLTVRDARAQRQAVQLGLRGIGHVEIASGLQAGDWVLAPDGKVREGQRVRPVPTATIAAAAP